MIITTNITMDLSRRGPTQVISAVQDDRCSRALAMVLTSGGVAWEPPEGTTAQIRYRKPDGTGGNYDALPDGTPAWTIAGNVLTVALAPQVCTVPGRVTLTAALVQGETQLHTFVVGIDVQPNPGLQATSENYYKIAGALPDSGWEPDRYLGTDSEGKVVTKTAPAGGLTLLGTVRPGQYLRVESVDENGNITVEAVDLDAKAITAYLYNELPLPIIPAVVGYGHAAIQFSGWKDDGTFAEADLLLSTMPLYKGTANNGITSCLKASAPGTVMRYSINLENGDTDWTLDTQKTYSEDGSVTTAYLGAVHWANYDVYNKGSLFSEDGTIHCSASEPVPVYE